ncbi:fimbrillin family protein [Bacteroides nordii]|uniref:Fimbrillin family protein n=2 Tax=Bacteroides nordii TaxID=291645 RepID=A0A413VIH5_9BACE|nr:fimbrillin family protein [Bacteroides nordii]RHB33359.1 fimbrillin family protein [Bacteroides nordii]
MKCLLYTGIVISLLCSCSEKDILPGDNELARTPLQVVSANLYPDLRILTRDVPESVGLVAGAIGIYLEGAQADEDGNIIARYADIKNRHYAYDSGSAAWKPADSKEMIYLFGTDASVCAYYPYHSDAAYADKKALPLKTQDYTDSNPDSEAADLYYALGGVVNGYNPGISFDLMHAYSMLELRISREDYPQVCAISAITLSNTTLAGTGTLDISTDGSVTITAIGDYSFAGLPHTVGSDDTYIRKALVVPCELADDTADATYGLVISLTVDGQIMLVSLPKSELPAFRQGEKYIVGLKIKGTELKLGAVTVMPWEVSQVGSDKYVPKPVLP